MSGDRSASVRPVSQGREPIQTNNEPGRGLRTPFLGSLVLLNRQIEETSSKGFAQSAVRVDPSEETLYLSEQRFEEFSIVSAKH
jgi:hypothetical protein